MQCFQFFKKINFVNIHLISLNFILYKDIFYFSNKVRDLLAKNCYNLIYIYKVLSAVLRVNIAKVMHVFLFYTTLYYVNLFFVFSF